LGECGAAAADFLDDLVDGFLLGSQLGVRIIAWDSVAGLRWAP
jgi:hypothetical protein